MSTRSDNIDYDDLGIPDLIRVDVKILMPAVDPRNMIFKSGKLVSTHYRVFAATREGELELYIGDMRTYEVSSARFTTLALAMVSDNLYLDCEILRSLINNLNADLSLQVADRALITFLPLLKRRVVFQTVLEPTDDATKLGYLRADFESYRLQSDKIIAQYKLQLLHAQQKRHDDLSDLLG